jgi:hypothetical protein
MKINQRNSRAAVAAGFTIAAVIAVASFEPSAKALSRKPSLLVEADRDTASGGGGATTARTIRIEEVEADHDKKPGKEVAWLGIATEEASETLSAQLGLKPGDGLVIVHVEPDSPAAKAGLQKNDVIVELGDQLLVHPGQLRKLVRRQKEGDTIKLSMYRAAKKQSVSATLAKTTERAGGMDEMNHGFQFQVIGNPKAAEALHEQMQTWHESLGKVGFDRQMVNLEVQREMEDARKAIHDALGRRSNVGWTSGKDAAELEALARGRVGVGTNTTVTLKRSGRSVKTMVKSDESGTYVLVANPKKRLTVHDQEGKLLFDGEIETQQQQHGVPADVWPKAQLMIEEMGPIKKDHTEQNSAPKARSRE